MTSTRNKHVTFLPAILFLFLCFRAFTQNYGHGWIDYGRRYFKIPVYREGIYRIDSATLAQGFDLATLDPRTLRVYMRGAEQFVHVAGESDGEFNAGDVVEFYADPSTKEADSLMYHEIQWLPNPYFSLFCDTIHAFITAGGTGSPKRYQQENDTAWSSYPAASFVYAEKLRAFNAFYNTAGQYEERTSDPRYTQTEGFGQMQAKGGSDYLAFAGTNVYGIGGLPAYFTLAYAGASREGGQLHDHEAKVSYRDNNGFEVVLSDTLYAGHTGIKQRFLVSSSTFNSASDFSLTSVSSPSFSSFNNSTVLFYMHLLYPSPLAFANPPFMRFSAGNEAGGQKAFYSFSGINLNGSATAVLYDLTDGRRIFTRVLGNGSLRAIIPNGSPGRRFILLSDSSAVKVKKLLPAGINGFFTNYFTQVKNDARVYLMISNNGLQNSAAAYRAYRESPAGGGWRVSLADVDELYDQYGWGYTKHPIAIRNFLRHMNDSLPAPPGNVLLLGTAVTPHSYPPKYFYNTVPTMGRPNSDNLLATGLRTPGHFEFYPDLPLGRIAASNDNEVLLYLDKVKEHEASGHAEWKKQVLHFVGGDSEALSELLSQYMNAYEQIIEDTLFGGEVRTFRKNSSAPIQVVLNDSIKDMVNKGAGLLTFFGHGNQYGFDQAIDEPQLYNNKGRYPFLYANSCYSGDLHDPNATTVSKKFVFAKEKGSIGFLATTSLAFTYALHNYAVEFYRALSSARYNQGIGAVVQEAARRNQNAGHPETNFVGLDMTLHGDPAVVIGNGPLPDYTLQNRDVTFSTGNLNDSIEVRVAMRNIGKAVADTFGVLLERYFPGGDTAVAFTRIVAPFFRDTVTLAIPSGGTKGAGLNHFRVTLDYVNEVFESNENNNATTGLIGFFVPGNDIVPVYPYDFAVVPKTSTIVLKASTIDPFAAETAYRFSLDTNDRFAAPLASTVITSKGGVVEWTVGLGAQDSLVYYWRVSKDSVNPSQSISWRQSSFQVLGTQRGWAQAHFDQFRNNSFRFVAQDQTLRRLVFDNRLNTINTRTGFHPWTPESQMTYFFNNNQMDNYSCTFNGWNFAVFDSITGEPQKLNNPAHPANGSGSQGNCLCNHGYPYQFVYYYGRTNECFPNDTSWKTRVQGFLNSIAPNNYVLAYTLGNAEMSTYGNSLYQAFEGIGSGMIRNVPDTVPMIIFGRKGMSAGQASEAAGSSRRTTLFRQDSIRTKWKSGYIASPVFGPSYRWQSLHWRVRSLDAGGGDTTVLKIVGIRADGSMDTLRSLSQDTTDLYNLQQFADASVYPYMKLVAYMKDDVYRTSPQLRSWHVLYDEAPEAALNPRRVTTIGRGSLQEGEKEGYVFPIENIGSEAFDDSLAVQYWIEDNGRNLIPLEAKLKPSPFKSGQLLFDTVLVDSYKLQGNNALWITFNSPLQPRYQKEQHYFNNVGRVPFTVSGDQDNPLLEVTFDGRRILNKDIVSARPSVLVTLKDENQFLALNDTSAFTITVQAPGQATAQRLTFARDLQFTPASLPRNSARVLYTPVLTTDGIYTLTAQASDRSNNRSGAAAYRIQFEVKNKPTVTNVLNYPNPFTTSTRFLFTLTGSEVPEVFTIQILTVTGKVVREITRNELGTLRIGRNITDYAWDGRDAYGDRLGNGVYLYRVITRLNGATIEKQSSGADQYFNREFGKMVLIR